MIGKCLQGIKGIGTLDYVSAWYMKAQVLIKNTKIRVALFLRNSISQGETTREFYGTYSLKLQN